MLHGFTGSQASFARLALPPSAVAPTLGGHLDQPASTDYWAEVERLAAHASGPKHASGPAHASAATQLFGYSLGGRLALGLLARYPERFERAVLVSAHPGLHTEVQRRQRRAHDARFVRLLRERGLVDFVAAWEDQPLWHTQGALPEACRAAKRRERLMHTAEGLARSLDSVGLGRMPDLRPELARVAIPVDFLAGAHDPKFVALARELCSIMPGARLKVAAGAGHDLLLERPKFCSAFLSQGASK
jgi:2-succinyl-6-hydroxy-2,4-cyclohexadiene-1-carboxylate synthase